MTDKYTRRFLCYIRWMLYVAGIFALMKSHHNLGFFLFFFGAILLGEKYNSPFILIRRYKVYAFFCIVYYLFVFSYVIYKSGQVFDHFSLFLLFILLPLIPELICIEISDYRGG
jgi:hypothetical protein